MHIWKRLAIGAGLAAIAFFGLRTIHAPEVSAQVRAALVRSVDEPARVPYFVSGPPTCGFTNECYVAGPVVPAGKRVRITRLQGWMGNPSATTGFAALDLNDTSHPVVMFPLERFSAAYFGTAFSFRFEVDFYLEAGQTPYLVVGSPTSLGTESRNRLSLAGYIVETTP